jgi:hypothetical protein
MRKLGLIARSMDDMEMGVFFIIVERQERDLWKRPAILGAQGSSQKYEKNIENL